MLQLADQKRSLVEAKKKLIQSALMSTLPIYILGRNRYSDIMIHYLNLINQDIKGVIDDYTDEQYYAGYSIFRMQEVPRNSIVISCVVDGKMITAIDELARKGIEIILTYCDFHLYNHALIPPPQFCDGNVVDIEQNKTKYEWLYHRLDDSLSKETLWNILNFRYTFDVDAMRNFSFRLDKQYFDVVQPSAHGIFVDGGGFDGATSAKYMSVNPEYGEIHIFEPSPEHVAVIEQKMSGYSRVFVHPYATFSERTKLRFDKSQGSASRLDCQGDIEVQTARMDDILEKATFIKLDVEGAEYDSLLGARRIITTHRPRLAICVYHAQEHFWRIPELICSYWPEYRVLLRHYTEGIMETVMYFI